MRNAAEGKGSSHNRRGTILTRHVASVVAALSLASCTYEYQIVTETARPVETKQEEIMLQAIEQYPAYIKDACGTVWGIPPELTGEYMKKRLVFKTTDGVEIPHQEIDLYTVRGTVYIVHRYTTLVEGSDDPIECVDTYCQTGDTIAAVDTVPDKPAESRATYNGTDWNLETTVVNGVSFSYLYSRNVDLINSMGNYSGKGAYVRSWPMVSGFVILERGIVVMTDTGSFFVQWGRTSPEFVSEPGRLWK